MSDLNIKIMNLICEGKSINEILEILKIGKKRLLIQLRTIMSEGYEFNKNITPDGNINLELKKDLNKNNIMISTKKQENLRVLVIADLHLGRKKDKLEYLDAVYDYAIKNNIGIILNLGDLIENTYHLPANELKKKTVEEQIDYVIKNYPFDKNIANILLYGNHDLYSLTHYGLNVGKMIEKDRYDLMSLGYGLGYLNLNKESICLTHNKTCTNTDYKIVFEGHSHRMMYKFINKRLIVDVPALSDATPASYDYNPLKGFLDITFEFNEQLVQQVYIKQQIIHYGIHTSCESKFKIR